MPRHAASRNALLSASRRVPEVGPREVHLALRRWISALALRPLLWSLPFVILGCVLGRAWADIARANSPNDIVLFAPALLGPICVSLRAALKYLQSPRSRREGVNWSAMWISGACILGLAGAHAARRWTPASDDASRLLRLRESRSEPLKPLVGRVSARVAEVRRGDFSDSAVLELAPSPATSRALSTARGRVYATMKHSPQVLAEGGLRAGDWVLARVELRESRPPGSGAEGDERTFALLRGCWCEGEVKGIESVSPPRRDWGEGWGAGGLDGELNGLLDSAREHVASRFERGFGALGVPFSHQSALLSTAMAFGEGGLREPLPAAMRQAFKRAGVSHVLVASGAQVAMVCLLLWSVSRLLCAPVRNQAARGLLLALLMVPALIFYALLVGGAASIWRATLVGLGALWIQSRGRRLDAVSLWCGALSLLLLCDPASLLDLSLQLSFGAAWGLIAFASPLQNLLLAPLRALEPKPKPEPEGHAQVLAMSPRILRAVASADCWAGGAQKLLWLGTRGLCGVAGVSVAAHVGTLPVLLHAFGTLSLGSLLANLPIVPLSALLVAGGGASMLLPLRPLDAFNYHVADGAARVVGVVSGWRSSWVEAPVLSLAWTLTLAVLALAAACAVAWPRLLLDAKLHQDADADVDDLDINSSNLDDDEPHEIQADERAALWRATAQALLQAAQAARFPSGHRRPGAARPPR